MESEQQPKTKTTHKTAYMREYKRKQYLEKGDEIKAKNKAYYYKYKSNITAEDFKKFDLHTPNVVRIRKELEALKEFPDIIKEILAPYLI